MANLKYEYKEGITSGRVNNFLLTRVALGAIVLTMINAGLLFWKPLAKVDPDSLPAAHTWVWWAAQEFLEQKKAPDVVMLGSSLLMHPVSRRDAAFLGQDIDYVKHHRSNYMEHLLAERGITDAVCYNFALPGGMVSDDYMIERAFFAQHKPKVLVLGLSIRDFIDNGVHCAGSTPAFKYLKRFCNIDDLVDISMPQLYQRADYLFAKGLYLWGRKLDLQVLLAEKTKGMLQPFYSRWFAPSLLAQADPERSQPSNLRAEVEEGMLIVKKDIPYSWDDNSMEYKKRYRSPNERGVKVQDFFFDKLLKEARAQGIKVVIMNMPLTQDNHNLMPAGSYDRYLATLKSQSDKYGCNFIDLDATHQFVRTDYYDTAHMNASGGKRLIDTMVASISANPELVAALKEGGATRPAVASQGHAL
ncbi:MAG TPA: hypothetical protein V6D22_06785 [Candidatus Obscuribacterales bacterium]